MEEIEAQKIDLPDLCSSDITTKFSSFLFVTISYSWLVCMRFEIMMNPQ